MLTIVVRTALAIVCAGGGFLLVATFIDELRDR
jgi:hypothetical protein